MNEMVKHQPKSWVLTDLQKLEIRFIYLRDIVGIHLIVRYILYRVVRAWEKFKIILLLL